MNEILNSAKDFLMSTGVYKLFYELNGNGEYIYNENWWQPTQPFVVLSIRKMVDMGKQ